MSEDFEQSEIGEDDELRFNGVDISGRYAFEPLTTAELADVALGRTLDIKTEQPEHWAALGERGRKAEDHLGVIEGVDPTRLDSAGWAVLFPATAPGTPERAEQDAIYAALSPLLALRRAQASAVDERLYREYRGGEGYRGGESGDVFLAAHGVSPGVADPAQMPYYLLIVASPAQVPFRVQYQIDVQRAVGRIDFDSVEAYANYARSVVAAESGELALDRELAFVGVANPDDAATQTSRKNLVGPLVERAASWAEDSEEIGEWRISPYLDGDADKAHVVELLGGAKTPALLFTASHGMSLPLDDPRQREHQGALLLQDWAGPKQHQGPISQDLYLCGEDIASDANLLGLISINFACYGAGTPRYDEFAHKAHRQRKAIAEAPFVAGLQRKMLGLAKGGALAAIGHVERAWGYSFMWGVGRGRKRSVQPQLQTFESALRSLMKGLPVGCAIDYFNLRYAELACSLNAELDDAEWGDVDPYSLASKWTAHNDARGYVIIGDPAVRLPLAPLEGKPGKGREGVEVSSFARVDAEQRVGAGPPAGRELDQPEREAGPVSSGSAAGAHFGVGVGEGPSPVAALAGLDELRARLLEDLVVRTYVSDELDGETIPAGAELRAQTRIRMGGEVDSVVPRTGRDGDAELWARHLGLVAAAQAGRAELLSRLLAALQGEADDDRDPPG